MLIFIVAIHAARATLVLVYVLLALTGSSMISFPDVHCRLCTGNSHCSGDKRARRCQVRYPLLYWEWKLKRGVKQRYG
jgi:hypothetical protein